MTYSSKLNKVFRRHLLRSRSLAAEDYHRKFIVVASLIVGNHMFTRTNSSTKTCPYQKRYFNGRTERVHAEINLLKRFFGMDIKGPMLVTRYARNSDGFSMARPCKYCQAFLRDNFSGLEVWYSGPKGEIWKLKTTEIAL